MTTSAHDAHPEQGSQPTTTRRHRPRAAVIAAAMSVLVATAALVHADSPTDDSPIEIATGNTWS